MNDFWDEEDIESDKAAFEYYDGKLHEKENSKKETGDFTLIQLNILFPGAALAFIW